MKRISRIGLLMMIVMGMILATAAVSFASEQIENQVKPEGKAPIKGVEFREPAPVKDQTKIDLAKKIAGQKQDGMTMNAKAMPVYRTTSYQSIWSSYPSTMYASYDSEDNLYYAVSQPGYVYRGMMYVYGYTDCDDVEFYVFDENGEYVKGFVMYDAYKDYCSGIYIGKTGNYYIIAVGDEYSDFTARFKCSNSPVYDYRSGFLANNRDYYSGHATGACTITYKFKAVATGAMRVAGDAQSGVKVTIKDTAGRVLGTTLNGNYDPTFGVQKGKIYMISVRWPSTSSDRYAQGTNRLRVINATWTSAAGRTKGTAATLKRGVYRKGLIISGQNNIGWYKFKPNKSVFRLYVEGATNDKFVYRVYCNNQYVSSTVFYQYNASRWNEFKGPKNATWYVKVERVNGLSSGRYQLKFQ